MRVALTRSFWRVASVLTIQHKHDTLEPRDTN